MKRVSTGQQGQVIVLFAILLPVFLGVGAIVIGVGNWFTHARHLQTKADAAALAGGSVWGFPCGPDVDDRIEATARLYVGPHTDDSGVQQTGPSDPEINPQVGRVRADAVHVILNGDDWYDDDSNAAQSDWTDPVDPNPNDPRVCDSGILDVKVTENNSFPLFSLMPVFPDLKRKARIRIHEVDGLSGVLPISVRVPKPVSTAAIYYNEANGVILDVNYFCETPAIAGLPAGLGGWTTFDPSNPNCASWSRAFPVGPTTGVAIATSFRPACDASASPPITANCFEDSGFTTVNDLCRQGGGKLVQCHFGTGTGASQSVQSGLQFIRGYETGPAVTDGPPELRGVWLTAGTCTNGYGSGYFASVSGSCSVGVTANFDFGSCMRGPGECYNDPAVTPPVETRTAANVEVKYTIVTGTGNADDVCDFGPTCDFTRSGTGQISANGTLTFGSSSTRHAIALRVRMKETFVPGRPDCSLPGFNGRCEWYFLGTGRVLSEPTNAQIFAAPVQRSFMGNDDASGPIKFLRLTADRGCNGGPSADDVDVQAASQPIGQLHCFFMEMGLKGAKAVDQDEPPVTFNLKASQSASLDCDPTIPNLKGEVVAGCSPFYRANDLTRDPACPALTSWTAIQNPPAPYNTEWPPYTCVLTQTGNPRQLLDGFLERFFGTSGSPSCPSEGAQPAPEFVPGRNYWHDANNANDNDEYTFAESVPTLVHGNNLQSNDPRKVHFFMTAYDSFTGSGNTLFPIVTFGTFYVTGIGSGRPDGTLRIEDPCDRGNSNPSPGAGNKPPPDIVVEPGGAYVWGHFIDSVEPSGTATPSDRICAPATSFMPCVPVLVE